MELKLVGTRIPLLPWGGRYKSNESSSKRGRRMVVRMRDRSKNRKPLQKGRNLSIEAIQAVQALKRAQSSSSSPSSAMVEGVMDSKFRRLLKFDMMAVLRELLRQNECILALKVFGDIQNENWYKPRVSLYADTISVMAANGLLEKVELLYSKMKAEECLEPEIEAFNSLLTTFRNLKLTGFLMDCYELMKAIDCEPDRSSFRILINGLESIGEVSLSAAVRQDAHKYYGQSLYFLTEEEETEQSCS